MTIMILTDKQTMVLLRKVLLRIKSNPAALKEYSRYAGRDELNYYRLGCAVGNHAFDDSYTFFGITQNEGENIRAFFHNSVWRLGTENIYQHTIKVWFGENRPTFFDRLCGRGPLWSK